MRTTRREFVGTAISAASYGLIQGANNRVRVGLVGCGGRGRYDAGLMRQVPGVEFAAVCDVYEAHALSAQQWAGSRCLRFGDFRRSLDNRDIDAVLIATPDHWHATIAALACQAGKDVYVEKPLGHNIAEGRAVVDAARRYNRVVQLGTQQRSAPHYAEAAGIIQSGQLGRVHFVRIWNYTNMYPEGIGRAPDSAPPAGLDWDFYLGPAPLVPFNKNRFLGTYRWFWDYAGGMVTDFGVHRFDSMRQVMAAEAPLSVSACGGRYALNDGGETPDVVQVTYEFPRFTFSYEACMLNGHGTGGRTPGKKYYLARGSDDRPHGEAFYGTNGALFSDRLGFEIYPEPAPVPGQGVSVVGDYPTRGVRMERREVAAEDATAQHLANFIDCVRSRQRPRADVEIGHVSTTVAHLGNIAYRTGRKIHWDAAREQIIGDAEANQLLRRTPRQKWNLLPM